MTGRDNVGGLVGLNFQNADINGSYYTGGTVTGVHHVGGLVGRSDLTTTTYTASITNSYYNVSNTLIGSTSEGAAAPAHHITLGGVYDTQFNDWLGGGFGGVRASLNTTPNLEARFGPAVGGFYEVDAKNIEYMLGYAHTPTSFRLKENIDLATLKHWDSSAGQFTDPIFQFHMPEFRGTLDGDYKRLDNLQVAQPFNDEVGFVGRLVNGTIRNLVVAGNSAVSGWDSVGGLVGYARNATLEKTGVDVAVTGKGNTSTTLAASSPSGITFAGVGGLVGKKEAGTISQSFSLGAVAGENSAGGLVGHNYHSSVAASISNSYASGSVTGTSGSGNILGGLVGYNRNGSLLNTYASGALSRADGVSGGYSSAGGLVGSASGGTMTASYFNSSTGGLGTTSPTGASRTLAQLQSLATFKPGTNDWSIRNTGTNASEIWRVYEGVATPVLTWALSPLSGTVGATPINKVYDATNAVAGSITWTGSYDADLVKGDATVYTSSKNVGTYLGANNTMGGVWSTQLGYDLALTGSAPDVTVTKADLVVTGGQAQDKVYNGTAQATVTGSTVAALGTDAVNLLTTGGATFANARAGENKAVTTAFTIDGADAGNYTLVQQTGLLASISPATLTPTVSNTGVTKVYDGLDTTDIVPTYTFGGLVGEDSVTLSFDAISYNSKNVLDANRVTVTALSIDSLDSLIGSVASDYVLDATSKDVAATITPKAVTLSASKTYDGTTDLTGKVALGGLIGDETLSYASATANDKHVATADKFISSLTLTDGKGDNAGLASNYQLPVLNAANAAVTITAATLTPTVSNTGVTKVYDGTTLGNLTPAYTFDGLVDGDTGATLSHTSVIYNDKNVADANRITVSGLVIDAIAGSNGSQATDYVLDDTSKEVAAQITRADLLVSGGVAQDKVYDGTVAATVTGSSISPIGEDAVNLSDAVASFANASAGVDKAVTTAFTLTGAQAGNYNLVQQSGLMATISPRPVTVAANAQTRRVGEPDPVLTYLAGCGGLVSGCGLVAGESLSGLLSRAAGDSAGTYAILQGSLTNAGNPNYAITYLGNTLTITGNTASTETPGSETAGANAAIATAQQAATQSTTSGSPAQSPSFGAFNPAAGLTSAPTGGPQVQRSGGLAFISVGGGSPGATDSGQAGPAGQGASGGNVPPSGTVQGGRTASGVMNVLVYQGGINIGGSAGGGLGGSGLGGGFGGSLGGGLGSGTDGLGGAGNPGGLGGGFGSGAGAGTPGGSGAGGSVPGAEPGSESANTIVAS